MTHPVPEQPGYYWAMLHTPTDMPEGQDWVSNSPEVVQVIRPGHVEDDFYMAFLPGIDSGQLLSSFTWLSGALTPPDMPDTDEVK